MADYFYSFELCVLSALPAAPFPAKALCDLYFVATEENQ